MNNIFQFIKISAVTRIPEGFKTRPSNSRSPCYEDSCNPHEVRNSNFSKTHHMPPKYNMFIPFVDPKYTISLGLQNLKLRRKECWLRSKKTIISHVQHQISRVGLISGGAEFSIDHKLSQYHAQVRRIAIILLAEAWAEPMCKDAPSLPFFNIPPNKLPNASPS